MTTLSESFSNSISWSAWAGDYSDLESALEVVEAALAGAVERHVTHETRWYEEHVETARKSRNRDRADFMAESVDSVGERHFEFLKSMAIGSQKEFKSAKQQLKQKRKRAEAAGKIRATLSSKTRGHRTVEGSPGEIVAHLRSRTFAQVSLRAPGYSLSNYSVAIEFDNQEGVSLTVQSSDSEWGTVLWDQLTHLLRRNVPWWRILRSNWLIGITVWLALFGWLSGPLLDLVQAAGDEGTSAGFVAGLLLVVPTLGTFYLVRKAVRWLVPAFDLTKPTSRARGAVAVGVFGSALLSVPIGIFINVIS